MGLPYKSRRSRLLNVFNPLLRYNEGDPIKEPYSTDIVVSGRCLGFLPTEIFGIVNSHRRLVG